MAERLSLKTCLDLIPAEQRYRLDHKVTASDVIAKIAKSITDWKYVGNFLPGIDKQDIVAIEHDAPFSLINQK